MDFFGTFIIVNTICEAFHKKEKPDKKPLSARQQRKNDIGNAIAIAIAAIISALLFW